MIMFALGVFFGAIVGTLTSCVCVMAMRGDFSRRRRTT